MSAIVFKLYAVEETKIFEARCFENIYKNIIKDEKSLKSLINTEKLLTNTTKSKTTASPGESYWFNITYITNKI